MCAVLLAVCALSGCAKAEDLSYNIVLITDGGTISDNSYNESAWNGIKAYAEEAGVDYRYYQPVLQDGEMTVDTVEEYLSLAETANAEYVVLPTSIFDGVTDTVAENHPDIKFIAIDGAVSDKENVMSVQFDATESGFLAGYMAVLSGNTRLGYLGSAVSDSSTQYGAGFVQGAAYAADETGQPVILDYANYDDMALQDSYSVTITANYEKVEDQSSDCFVVNVVNGKGSGTYSDGSNVTVTADPAPEGMVFDHWDYASDTEGVRDRKVNLSTTSKTETNLLVEECDCTITAVYVESEEPLYQVTVLDKDGTTYSQQNVAAGGEIGIAAPPAESGMVFSHWEMNAAEEAIANIEEGHTTVYMDADSPADIELKPVYGKSDVPTFDVTVVTGEGGSGESSGSGTYEIGEYAEIAAALPEEGYMFKNWSNVDANGFSAGIAMESEYTPYTSFNMVDLHQSIAENMYDNGISMIYSAGNDEIGVVSDATWNYSFQVWAIGAENYQSNWGNYYTTPIRDYGAAVQQCIENYAGGKVYTANCEDGCIWLSYVPEENLETYDAMYEKMASGSIKINTVSDSSKVATTIKSNLLTLDYNDV